MQYSWTQVLFLLVAELTILLVCFAISHFISLADYFRAIQYLVYGINIVAVYIAYRFDRASRMLMSVALVVLTLSFFPLITIVASEILKVQ